MTPTDTPAAQAAAGGDLARALRLTTLSLAFGRVERATRHEDGRRPETDTDHTVMLALVACELAPPGLDRAKIAAFALVHDLPEVHAGDTQTLVISPEATAAKRDREDAARARLTAELGAGSWVASTLAAYEQQRVPEARFVRAVDKVLPKLTHAFNGCAAARALTDRAGFAAAHERQLQKLRDEYPEFPDAIELLRASMVHSEGCWTDDAPPVTADLARLRAPLAGDLAAIERKALSLLAGTTPGRIDVHRCDADSGAIDYQLQRAPGSPATVLGYATDSDGSSRAKADATLWAHAHEMTTAVVTLARHIAAQQAAHAVALDAAVAAARAEALREASAAMRGVMARQTSAAADAVVRQCIEAVAALGAKGGGA